MTDKEFCKLDTEFYGEVVDHIKQIKLRSFDGEELKEYVEHCIKLHLLELKKHSIEEIENYLDTIGYSVIKTIELDNLEEKLLNHPC
jgi:hypothetical protein